MFIDKIWLYELIFRMLMIPLAFLLLAVILFFQVNLFSTLLYLEETVTKEKIWSLISQNEPSLVPASMVVQLSLVFNKLINLHSYCYHLHLLICRSQNCRLRIVWLVLIFLRCYWLNILAGLLIYKA